MKTLEDWDTFLSLTKGRNIYIYGGNLEGIGICRMLANNGVPANGIIDSRPFNNGFLRGTKVIDPSLFNENPDKSFIIICTKHRATRANAKKFCESLGYIDRHDFIYNSTLCQSYPTIETVGICNLRCITCDMGIPGANHKQKMISVDTFTKILTKMKSEIPFLSSISLYQWGEPLLHPKIGELVNICHDHGVSTELSSNLNNIHNLESLIKSDPEVLIISSSGFGGNYEITHTGGNFRKFRNNCISLRKLIDLHKTETFVKYYYLVYNNNSGEEMEQAYAFASELGFNFQPILANILPAKVHDYVVFGKPLPDVMLEANKYLVYDIHNQIQWAQAEKDKPCPMIKAFPSVRWDGSVMLCCDRTEPAIGNGYLNTSLPELVTLREESGFCQRCISHGMHRVFNVHGREDNPMSALTDRLKLCHEKDL